MPRHRLPVAVAVLIALAASLRAAESAVHGQRFTLPDGFEVELVAAPPLVERPVSASFDDRGRLYVTDSSGSNEKPDKQVLNPTHRLLRLEDTDGDGRFDRSVVFAEKVMFPQGCLWHQGSVYVAGPPSIWKFTDVDGDGVAEQREEWFNGGTLTGCANDIHGPYLGPDGYLYWTKGAFAEQTHTLGDGRKLNDRAAHILRSRPDGSDLGVVMTGGMDNPVQVAFTPEGEAIFTSTFIDFSQPGFRDGIGHAVYGGVFGKQNDVLEDGRVKRASPDLMHPFFQAGNAAECGLCRYESDAFGSGYRDNFFATAFNLHKVTRHVLRPAGATFSSTDSDFLVSDSTDFHPTDVLPDADGSLLVVDTGGWYKLCCPSSQLAKPDVLGAIYRIRRQGAPKLPAAERPKAYSRLNQPSLNRDLPATPLKELAIRRDVSTANQMVELLKREASRADQSADSAGIVRNAAEGLGRMRHPPAVPALLRAVGLTRDPILQQSLIFALIEIAEPSATAAGLASSNPAEKRAALIALDQMDGGGLTPVQITPLLTSSDAGIRRIAAWIAGRHPQWGGALADSLRQRLANLPVDGNGQSELQQQLAQFARDIAVQELLAATVRDPRAPVPSRLLALRSMAQARLKEAPASWTAELGRILRGNDPDLIAPAIATVRELTFAKSAVPEITAALTAAGEAPGRPDDIRLEALAALPAGISTVSAAQFDFLVANLEPSRPVAVRGRAAGVLAKAKLSPAQLSALTDVIRTASPLEITRLLSAFDGPQDEALGFKLLAAIEQSKGLSSLSPGSLKPRLTNFPVSVQERGDVLLARLNVDARTQKSHLDELERQLKGGDVRRGQAVFNSTKAACASCHAMGYLGGKVGPDLTSIGQARTERDLLEAIIYPSASFVRSYEPVIVVLKTGDEQSGVLRGDTPDEVVLATGPETEVRIARSDITEIRPGLVSVMPQGLDEQLSKAELADLVAFLKHTTWGPR